MESSLSPSTCSHENSDFYRDQYGDTNYRLKICRDCKELIWVNEDPPTPSIMDQIRAREEFEAEDLRTNLIGCGYLVLLLVLCALCWPWIASFMYWIRSFYSS